MKWNKLGRGTLASVLSLALVSVTACSRDYVLAYVYVTTAKPLTTASKHGGINAYAVDYQIGSLTPLADSPIEAGTNPVTLVASPNGLNLYVVNHDDSTIGVYAIGTDGKIFLQSTVNMTGSNPTSIAIDSCRQVSLRHLSVPVGSGWPAALLAGFAWAGRRHDLPDIGAAGALGNASDGQCRQ